MVVRTAHSFKVAWDPPKEETYGKVIRYETFGRQVGSTSSSSSWNLLYDGPNAAFCVGTVPEAAILFEPFEALESTISTTPSPDEIYAIHSSLQCYTRTETDQEDSALSYAAVALLTGSSCAELPPGSSYEIKVTATCGTWFNGEFHSNIASGNSVRAVTPQAFPDCPPMPFAKPYHGTVTATSLDLSWRAPMTYGNGHSVETFLRAITTTVPIETRPKPKAKRPVKLLKKGSSLKIIPSHSVKDLTSLDPSVEESNLRNEGWQQQVDLEGGYSYWSNSLTNEVQHEKPVIPGKQLRHSARG